MKFLIDKSATEVQRKMSLHPSLVRGQLCTPLTGYKNWGGEFALDNGAFSGLDREAWFRLLEKHLPHLQKCLFVTIPDVVGNARRTTELYFLITKDQRTHPYTDRWAFVMQDGHEDMHIDWLSIRWLFIGGTDRFKDSAAAYDIAKTAKALAIPVHVGRVNTLRRYESFAELGCDTCDGSGVAMYDHMLDKIAAGLRKEPEPTLFDELQEAS